MIESLEEAPTQRLSRHEGAPSVPALDIYQGPLGDAYWARNRAAVMEQAWLRRAHLRTLAPRWADEPWLEAGCGVRANLYARDVGFDVAAHPWALPGDIRQLPCASGSFAVTFCVGVLMHLPDGEWQRGLAELARVAQHVVIIGEYEADREMDLLWNPETGAQGAGQPGLLWARPYSAPLGWKLTRKCRPLPGFGSDVTFFGFARIDKLSMTD